MSISKFRRYHFDTIQRDQQNIMKILDILTAFSYNMVSLKHGFGEILK